MPEMMYSGCICGYSALNFDKIFMLCKGSGTCICLEEKACLAAGEPQFPVGMIKEDGFICKVGLPCCTCGLKIPDAKDLISTEGKCLCMESKAQFPVGDKGARDTVLLRHAPRRHTHPSANSLSVTPRADRVPACGLFAVKEPMCAICFVQLMPKFAVVAPAPGGGPESAVMER